MRTSQPPLGPRPARTDRPAPAALRVLRALVAADRPTTIAALSAELGGHSNTVRHQLEHLVETGFAEQARSPGARRGRPASVFTATIAGRQVAVEDTDRDDQRGLLTAVAAQLGRSPDPRTAALELGRAWGSALGAPPGGLPELLARQGFTPRATPEGILLQTCPLLDVARRNPEVVCSIHQGLIDATSESPAELVPFAVPGACLIRV